MKLFFSFSHDWFQVTLDQRVQGHKKWVATGGNYMEKVNRTLDIKNVSVTSACFKYYIARLFNVPCKLYFLINLNNILGQCQSCVNVSCDVFYFFRFLFQISVIKQFRELINRPSYLNYDRSAVYKQ